MIPLICLTYVGASKAEVTLTSWCNDNTVKVGDSIHGEILMSSGKSDSVVITGYIQRGNNSVFIINFDDADPFLQLPPTKSTPWYLPSSWAFGIPITFKPTHAGLFKDTIVFFGHAWWDTTKKFELHSYLCGIADSTLTNVQSITDQNIQSFSIFPNPVTNIVLNITSVLAEKHVDIKIYNSVGTIVSQCNDIDFTYKNFILQIPSLDNGVYIVEINSKNVRFLYKFLTRK